MAWPRSVHETMQLDPDELTDIEAYQLWTYKNPIKWLKRDMGIDLWWKQEEIMGCLPDCDQVTVRSGNGVGKSYLASAIVHWYLACHSPGYAIITSSSWKSVEKTIWPKIKTMRENSPQDFIRESGKMLDMEWKLGNEWGAFSVSTNSPENFAGFRTSYGVLVVVDEASAMEEEIFEAILGLCSTKGSKIFLIGNPLRASGPFYTTHKTAGWKKFHISAKEIPRGDHAIPGLADDKWVERAKKVWGIGSQAYQARVEGDFPDESDDTILSLMEVERSMNLPNQPDEEFPVTLGVDVGRYGSDPSVICAVRGMYAYPFEVINKKDTMFVTGKVVEAIKKYNPIKVNVDEIGIGSGVVDRLREMGYDGIVEGVNVACSPQQGEEYTNLRAEGWFTLRDWTKNGGKLPDDDQLRGELTSIKYAYTSTNRIQIESKELTRKKLGRSPNKGDALMLALLPERRPVELW